MSSVDHDPDRHPDFDRPLPEDWTLARLGVIADSLTYGYTASATAGSHGPRFLRITDIQNGRVDWDSVPTCSIGEMDIRKYGLVPGDIVFARTGATTGKSFLIRSCPLAVFASYLIRLRLLPEINPALLDYFFQTPDYWTFISDNVAGIAQPNCNATKLSELQIPIPPSGEQQRLVEAIAVLLSKVAAAREHLSRVPAILKRFRQAVLAAACSGRLTEDWRAENSNIEFPVPRQELIKIISRPKRRAGRLWGAGVVPELTDEEKESLPELWIWTKVRDLGEHPEDTVQVGPMSMRSKDFDASGVPVLNVGCVQWGHFDESKLDYMPPAIAAGFERYRIAKSDVLFTRSGTVGRCAVAKDRQHGYLMTFHLLRVRPSAQKCLPEYLQMVFQGARNIRRQTEEAAIGSTRAGFNTNLLADLDVPLPPLPEQREIVRIVSKLFQFADALDERISAAASRAYKLTQSILAKAFRGELVPTEAELARREGRKYEPASVLLERIKKEKASLDSAKRLRSKRATSRGGKRSVVSA